MREFKIPDNGVTIVDFGLSLTVTAGQAVVHYDDAEADYFAVLEDGKLFDSLASVTLDAEQLHWLKEQRTWVERRIADDQE